MTYYTPTALSDALDILSKANGQIVAGGTDVYPSSKKGQTPDYFLDITRIKDLKALRQSEDGTYFGAAVTWSDIIAARLPAAFDALKAASREIGSVQIQNAGTLVGNICNASPAADGVPALLALDATVQIESATRPPRRVSLADFITGIRTKALAADEMVSGIHIPPHDKAMRSAFEKLGSRRYLVISICMTAANITVGADGRIVDARVAVGACSTVAQRLTALEQALIGARPETVQITAVHLDALAPIDDVRGTSDYRLDVVKEQIRRAIAGAIPA
jgi:CO/xanthine dehydrogenase FAD-binding subunit